MTIKIDNVYIAGMLADCQEILNSDMSIHPFDAEKINQILNDAKSILLYNKYGKDYLDKKGITYEEFLNGI